MDYTHWFFGPTDVTSRHHIYIFKLYTRIHAPKSCQRPYKKPLVHAPKIERVENAVTPESEVVRHVKMYWILLAKVHRHLRHRHLQLRCPSHYQHLKRKGKKATTHRCANAYNAEQCFVIIEYMVSQTHLTTKNSLTS